MLTRRLACLVPLFLCLWGCGGDGQPAGPPLELSKREPLGKSELLMAEINMGAGDLRVYGLETDEVAALFRYSKGLAEPQFQFENKTFKAWLKIDTKGSVSMSAKMENKWSVELPNRAATDLSVRLGAGEADLKLGSIDLRKVDFQVGAGQVKVDLRGTPKHDYEVDLKGGVGECQVIVPAQVGVHAEATGGLGEIVVNGLDKKSGYWENAAFSGTGPKIRLKIKGGIGSIKISAE